MGDLGCDREHAINVARNALLNLRSAARIAWDHRQDRLCQALNEAANGLQEEIEALQEPAH